MKKLITCLVLLIPVISVKTNVKAAILTAVASANWNDINTWDSNTIPVCGDTIVVPALFDVRIASNVNLNGADPLCPLVRIQIEGRLYFNGGRKIRLAEGACMTVEFGGQLFPSPKGGGASEAVRVGNVNWWQSSEGILDGYEALGCQILLPITMTDFNLSDEKGTLVISWTMASEDDVNYYIVEKSLDGLVWLEIKEVTSRPLESGSKTYSCTDEQAVWNDVNYYRVKSVMENGSVVKFETAVWNPSISATKGELKLAPNPVGSQGIVTLTFDFDDVSQLNLTVVNHLGQIVKQEVLELKNNENQYIMNRDELGSGHYFVSLSSSKTQLNSKLVIL